MGAFGPTYITHTPKYQPPLSLPPQSFPFRLRLLAPSRSLCLCTQTNQSSFDLLEMSLASERHFECDEWGWEGAGEEEGLGGAGGCVGIAGNGWYDGAFSAGKVLLKSRAHYKLLGERENKDGSVILHSFLPSLPSTDETHIFSYNNKTLHFPLCFSRMCSDDRGNWPRGDNGVIDDSIKDEEAGESSTLHMLIHGFQNKIHK